LGIEALERGNEYPDAAGNPKRPAQIPS
jgi:hypothetical protein